MPSAFDDCCKLEQESVGELVAFLDMQADSGRVVLTSKGRLSRMLQETIGDAIMQKNGNVLSVEFKIEAEDKYHNFFLETWSNRSRFNRGWLDKLDTDVLLYYFKRERLLYCIPFQKLKKWAFGNLGEDEQLTRFRERCQSKREQRNDTWGRCVPIDVVGAEVGFTRYDLGKSDEPALFAPLAADNGYFPEWVQP